MDVTQGTLINIYPWIHSYWDMICSCDVERGSIFTGQWYGGARRGYNFNFRSQYKWDSEKKPVQYSCPDTICFLCHHVIMSLLCTLSHCNLPLQFHWEFSSNIHVNIPWTTYKNSRHHDSSFPEVPSILSKHVTRGVIYFTFRKGSRNQYFIEGFLTQVSSNSQPQSVMATWIFICHHWILCT